MADELSSLQGRETGTTADNIRLAERAPALPTDAAWEEIKKSARMLRLAMASRETCAGLRGAVLAAASRDSESMDALRLAVSRFTTELRDDGATPEAVLISLKAIVSAGGGPLISRSLNDWSGYILREKMSTWCIDEYFSEDTPRRRENRSDG